MFSSVLSRIHFSLLLDSGFLVHIFFFSSRSQMFILERTSFCWVHHLWQWHFWSSVWRYLKLQGHCLFLAVSVCSYCNFDQVSVAEGSPTESTGWGEQGWALWKPKLSPVGSIFASFSSLPFVSLVYFFFPSFLFSSFLSVPGQLHVMVGKAFLLLCSNLSSSG